MSLARMSRDESRNLETMDLRNRPRPDGAEFELFLVLSKIVRNSAPGERGVPVNACVIPEVPGLRNFRSGLGNNFSIRKRIFKHDISLF